MVNVITQWVCDICGYVESEHQNSINHNGTIIKWGDAPQGWSLIEHKLVCRRHEIVVKNKNTEPNE